MRESPSHSLSAVVLAGGLSTRFGSDKASALLHGRPLLQWVVAAVASSCSPIVVVRARGRALPAMPGAPRVMVVDDRWMERGPLAGLATGLAMLGPGFAFAASCDMPLLSAALPPLLVSIADGFDVVVPVIEGRRQPLAALYRAGSCLTRFEQLVEAGQGRLLSAFDGLNVCEVGEEELEAAGITALSFSNANDPSALARMELEARAD